MAENPIASLIFEDGCPDCGRREVELPEGETHIRILAFVPDVNLYIPDDMTFSLGATAFVTDFNFKGDKRDHVFVPVDYTTENYRTAACKLRVELTGFVVDLDVR